MKLKLMANKTENKRTRRFCLKIVKHCESEGYPPVESAKALLLAAAASAKVLGITRKLFLDTAKQMFDGIRDK